MHVSTGVRNCHTYDDHHKKFAWIVLANAVFVYLGTGFRRFCSRCDMKLFWVFTVKSKNGKWKSSCRLKNVTKPAELFHEFPFHNIRAKWQMQQLKQLTQILLQNHCITIRDFSENYKCCNLNKIQSNYFQKIKNFNPCTNNS